MGYTLSIVQQVAYHKPEYDTLHAAAVKALRARYNPQHLNTPPSEST